MKRPKSLGKRTGRTMSVTKLSNKRLNKLAKQGKLKSRGEKRKKLLHLIKDRTRTVDDPHQMRPEDIPLEEADYEYFATKDRDFSFLTSIKIPDERKPKKSESNHNNEEHVYEKVPRRTLGGDELGMKPGLPIKSKEHGLQTRMVHDKQAVTPGEEQEASDDEEEEEEEEMSVPLPPLTLEEMKMERQERLSAAKERMSSLAIAILSEPEQNVGKLRSLRLMLEDEDPLIAVSVRKYAMLSLLEVFKDIIPAYRIRAITDKEKGQAAKKETKKLRDFEESLMNNYRHYLEVLEAMAKGKPLKTADKKKKQKSKFLKSDNLPKEMHESFVQLSVRCLCELLVTHPHFNFRTNIVSVIAPFANHRTPVLSDMVCGYVKRIFKEDREGELTLEVVRLIGRMIKAHHFRVQPKVLYTFLSLRIKHLKKPDEGAPESVGEKRAKFRRLSRRDRKRKKEMKHLEKELEEAAVETNQKHKYKLQTETISVVFLTYFRLLKQSKQSLLLSAVLQGLAKFAHLVNIEFFEDLFSVLNDLVMSETLTNLQTLHCIQTAFTILTGQGSALNIDPLHFYTHMYQCLTKLNAGCNTEFLTAALQCLELMICKRRKQVSTTRLLAFMKRLSSTGLQQLSHGALGILSMLRTFLQMWTSCEVLLDTSSEGSGVYLPDLDQPEHCNAHMTALYELHLLKHHYHPAVGRFCRHILAGAPTQGHHQLAANMMRRSPVELVKDFDPSEMTFNPNMEEKPRPCKKQKRMPRPFRDSHLQHQTQLVMDSLCHDVPATLNFYPDKQKTTRNK